MTNYVILAPQYDYTRLSYDSIINDTNIHYISGFTDSDSLFLRIIFRLLYSTIHKFLPISRSYFNKYRLTRKYKASDRIVFIVYADFADIYLNDGSKFIDYLKKTYPQAKFVWFSVNVFCPEKQSDIDTIYEKFDLLITTELGDTKKYRMIHYPDFMSLLETEYEDKQTQESDFFFLGAAKKRLKEIINVYDYLEGKGYDCLFFVTGASPNEHVHRKGLHYVDKISYLMNISYVKKAKCVVEICNPGQVGSTLRATEAVLYEKKLITNNKTLKYESYYKENNILFLDEIEHVHDFMAAEYTPVSNARDLVGPSSFIRFIEKELYR